MAWALVRTRLSESGGWHEELQRPADADPGSALDGMGATLLATVREKQMPLPAQLLEQDAGAIQLTLVRALRRRRLRRLQVYEVFVDQFCRRAAVDARAKL